jgi:hypothetical protein|tara:strand:+ start:41329 stop:41613 length:285 start_codon:yes stop_codon:yes gene_type:complete
MDEKSNRGLRDDKSLDKRMLEWNIYTAISSAEAWSDPKNGNRNNTESQLFNAEGYLTIAEKLSIFSVEKTSKMREYYERVKKMAEDNFPKSKIY